MTKRNPTLELISPLRTFVSNYQWQLTRDFDSKERVQISEIPDARKRVLTRQQEAEEVEINVAIQRSNSNAEDEEEEIQSSTNSEAEGTTTDQEGVCAAQAGGSPMETEKLRQTRDSIHQSLCVKGYSVLIHTTEENRAICHRYGQVEQVSSLWDRLNALESFANHSLPAICVMLEHIQQLLDSIEARALRPTQMTHTREEIQERRPHKHHEFYTNQIVVQCTYVCRWVRVSRQEIVDGRA